MISGSKSVCELAVEMERLLREISSHGGMVQIICLGIFVRFGGYLCGPSKFDVCGLALHSDLFPNLPSASTSIPRWAVPDLHYSGTQGRNFGMRICSAKRFPLGGKDFGVAQRLTLAPPSSSMSTTTPNMQAVFPLPHPAHVDINLPVNE
jgi:hypothetical protein